MNAPSDHCAKLLREIDFERYISVLLAPPAARPHLFALYAFHHEIAGVAERISEPMPGEIRLQWWRDAIAGIHHGNVGNNPVAAALLESIDSGALNKALLQKLVDARSDALQAEPPEDLGALKQSVLRTTGNLLLLAAGTNGEGVAPEHAGLVKDAAIAEGLVGVVRNMGFDAARGNLTLPLDLLAKHNVHSGDLLRGEEPEGLCTSIAELLDEAERAVGRFNTLRKNLPKPTHYAFRTLALVRPRIELLRKADQHLRSVPADLSPLSIVWQLWRNKI